MTHLLPVYARTTLSYPGDECAEVTYAPLETILTEPAEYDAFFSCYSVPDLPYRLNKEVLQERAIPMVVLVFDVDDPVAHRDGIPARAEWRAAEMFKISALLSAHDSWVAETKGGYRVVAGWLPDPFLVTDTASANLWSALYKTQCRALKRRFGIVADERCADWQRLMRIPRARRDGAVQDLPTYGDPAKIGVWEGDFTDEDVVEPEDVSEAKPRPTMRTSPSLNERILDARGHAQTLKPAVQGAGAEDALWAACNEVLVGFDLDVESAYYVIEQAYLPRCDVELLGPEHFMQRAQKKLEELNEKAEKPYGWRIDAQKRVEDVARLAGVARPVQRADSRQHPVETDEEREKVLTPSLAEVLNAFDPRIQRLATPFPTLNAITRGGLPQKSVVVFAGAPGAGKTSLVAQLGGHFLEQGKPVCLLAGDESIEFLLGRLAQRKGISRDDIEDGKAHAKDALMKAAEAWDLLFLDCDWAGCTVEYAAWRLHKEHGPGVLIVDSIQKTRTDTSGDADGPKAKVDDVIGTLKQAAAKFGHIVIATSEVGRSNYRNKNDAENSDDLAAAKESGDIEYGCKLMFVLKQAKEDEDLIVLTTPKNRLGRGRPKWSLKWDHVRATFTEVEMREEDAQETDRKARAKTRQDVLLTLQEMPGRLSGLNKVVDAMRRLGRPADRTRISAALTDLEFELKISKQGGFYAIQQSGT